MSSEQDVTGSIILGADPSLYQVDYTPLPSVERFHDLPRFSRSDDFSLLFSSNPDEVRHYSLGLMFLAVLIICCFVTWAIAILILKCIGPKHVGVFSGYPYQKEGCKATAGRSTLAFSSFIMIILTIILVTNGLSELQYTSDTVRATNNDVIKIHDEFQVLATNLKDVSRRANPVRDQLMSILRQDICPLRPGTPTETTVKNMGNETLQGLEQLGDFLNEQLSTVDTALAKIQHSTTQVNLAIEKTQFNGPLVTAILFPFFVVPAFVLVAVLMGWWDVFSQGYYTFMTWCIMPLMAILTAVAFFGAGWVLVSLQGNSDFCYAPQDNIAQILARYEWQPGQLYHDAVVWYTQQCDTTANGNITTNPWTFLEVYQQQLQQTQSDLDSFLSLVLDQSPEQLSQECGIQYFPIMDLLNTFKVHATILLTTTTRSLHLVSCDAIVPLYNNAVYDGVCNASIVAGKYCFSCLLLMAFFGMLCVMFRGSYFPIDYFYFVDDEDDDGDGGKDGSLYSTSEDDEFDDTAHIPQQQQQQQELNDSMMGTADEVDAVERYGKKTITKQ
ncbi:hypothetical protein IV203_012789 [Nitzschia inconspicua]|uniref:Uncharacterized protein n=1 Tax=Nitzschia inconspicua TaxID=303405 RepID=A0A9K3KU63_9STRA|nr:hypothetical protein IV203_012761 [Nitzschia inconspicua]KAG7350044.1 hypothetical protein IV203_012641 [Nitzschia inconspicua]KAG7373694.1 hypothetical protein IV203_012789 [Nitzschia inconspicua]